MGNQIDGQLGSMCTVAFGAALRAHLAAGRRAVQLPRHERRPAHRAAGDPRRRARRPPRRRASAPTSTPTSSRTTARTDRRTSTHTQHPTRTSAPTARSTAMTSTSTVHESATAAASGASATERFHTDKSPYDAVKDVPAERVDTLAREVLDAVYATVRKHKVTYDEFNALKAWMIDVGEDGEWPLFLDVWLEHVVEEVNTEHREGNKGSIEGPYYVPGAPEQGARGTIPMREDEGGTPLTWSGQVTSTDGSRARRRQGRAVARGLGRLLLPVRPRHPGVEPARHLHGRRRRHLRDPHGAARAVPDPHRRLLRQADRRRRLARLAAGAPARQGVRARPRAAHRPALLPRRRAQRRRHRLGGQARAGPRPAGAGRRHAPPSTTTSCSTRSKG